MMVNGDVWVVPQISQKNCQVTVPTSSTSIIDRTMKVEILENEKTTKIIFKGRVMDGIKMPRRSGSGPHKRKDDKVRGNLARDYNKYN